MFTLNEWTKKESYRQPEINPQQEEGELEDQE